MPLKDRVSYLKTPEEVDAFLAQHPNCALFKVGVCHKTQETFTHVQRHLEQRDDVPLGIIRVVEWRPASNHVAALTSIQHESPQLIVFRDGKPVFDRDNWDISDAAVAEGLATLPVAVR